MSGYIDLEHATEVGKAELDNSVYSKPEFLSVKLIYIRRKQPLQVVYAGMVATLVICDI